MYFILYEYRWRVNSKEFATPWSKKGLFRGYLKYGVAAYMGWFYLNKTLSGGGDHGHESHGEEHGKGH